MRKLLGARFPFLKQDEDLSVPTPKSRDIGAISQEIQREKLLYLL